MSISRDRLRELFLYDLETGVFTYLTRASQRTRVGTIAGSVNDEGYRHIRADGRSYKAHRIAWLYVTGEWPSGMLDHANGNRDDNRFANLREATRSQNLANSKITRKDRALHKGVAFVGSRWRARIHVDGERHFLGSFKTQSEAVAAYTAAARKFFGNFARGE